jgi:hypothetical protein
LSQPLDAELWRTQIPDDWVAEAEDESILVFHPDGAGTLQFTCSEMEDGLVDDEDLRYFAEELLTDGVVPTSVSLGPMHGLKFEYDDEDTGEWVQEWYLAADDLFFFVTYSCPRAARGAEDAAVATILGALELNE